MKEHHIGIIMNGVTGRMGTNQHLIRSICAIRDEGGLPVGPDAVIIPEPILVGRNINKLKKLSETHGIKEYTTDLDKCLSEERFQIYFDAQTTDRRVESVRKAIAAKKSIYCEKPTAVDLKSALELHQEATAAGVKNGVVQDKLWLPGLLKLQSLIRSGFFGQILSVRGEFGYWVYEGEDELLQRPSWNYRAEDGGGIILDMLCHWRYVVDNIFGKIKAVSNIGATHIKKRWDEAGKPYECTTDDSAYTTMELENGIIVQINSSWCVRPRRDDLFVLQVDGTNGSAYAGLRQCMIQPRQATPREVWNPDIDRDHNLFEAWQEVPDTKPVENAFRSQWELFLRHVVLDEPFQWNLLEGAKGVQLAEIALQSWEKRQWLEIPPLD
ncbi:MAG: Gfo/Idh/MocA family oxidoreductase [SAR324 cluster bacterium]|nr:Gfo/Idh/MocA family oxidoreductase [SAR324 cluster bacterium]